MTICSLNYILSNLIYFIYQLGKRPPAEEISENSSIKLEILRSIETLSPNIQQSINFKIRHLKCSELKGIFGQINNQFGKILTGNFLSSKNDSNDQNQDKISALRSSSICLTNEDMQYIGKKSKIEDIGYLRLISLLNATMQLKCSHESEKHHLHRYNIKHLQRRANSLGRIKNFDEALTFLHIKNEPKKDFISNKSQNCFKIFHFNLSSTFISKNLLLISFITSQVLNHCINLWRGADLSILFIGSLLLINILYNLVQNVILYFIPNGNF